MVREDPGIRLCCASASASRIRPWSRKLIWSSQRAFALASFEGARRFGSSHEGQDEVLNGKPCKSCHNAVSDWGLPGSNHFFVGKTDEQLCTQFSDFAAKMGPSTFISNHLVGDNLIKAAFLGRMGGARPLSMPADPPPITQAAFVNLGRDWLNQGQGACVVEGTITQEETVTSNDIWKQAHIDWRVEQAGKRTVTISLNAGQYTAHIEVDRTLTTTAVQHLQNAQGLPCTLTSTVIVKHFGTTSGAATVSTQFIGQLFLDTQPPQKDYRIDVTLPPERTTKTETTITANHCGGAIASGTQTAPPETSDWPPFDFTIEGHLDDPNLKYLVGACDKVVKWSDVKSRSVENDVSTCNRFADVGNSYTPWLINQDGGSNHDATGVPFRVVTFWNIAYHP